MTKYYEVLAEKAEHGELKVVEGTSLRGEAAARAGRKALSAATGIPHELTINEFFDRLVEELDRLAEEKERERTYN